MLYLILTCLWLYKNKNSVSKNQWKKIKISVKDTRREGVLSCSWNVIDLLESFGIQILKAEYHAYSLKPHAEPFEMQEIPRWWVLLPVDFPYRQPNILLSLSRKLHKLTRDTSNRDSTVRISRDSLRYLHINSDITGLANIWLIIFLIQCYYIYIFYLVKKCYYII